MKRYIEVLQNKDIENYILPFFWMHGEDEALLRKGVRVVFDAGIRAICVESRPHPDWAGQQWWHDLDIVIEEAKKYGMKVWILDDAHFPTGFMNGRIDEFPEARKQFAVHFCVDAYGPAKEMSFAVNLLEDEKLLGVVAARRDRRDTKRMLDLIDISDKVSGNRVFWDVPEGIWSVVVLKTSFRSRRKETHANLIDREAVRKLLDVCYEPHWNHYKEEFGKTILGFFSDEPQIGNEDDFSTPDITQVGNMLMKLPWCEELESILKAQWKESFLFYLLGCWYDIPDITPKARLVFMDSVSALFQKNFSEQVGDWCRSHNVEYIGHVIEDNGNHDRLGLGAGHYFRALWGQDMAGVDIVLQQIRPGLNDLEFYRIGGTQFYNGTFFHNMLGKLCTSLSSLDSKKRGRNLCEIFGAYGWSEGLKLMKWLVDHMLVNGINYFVPHAFSFKEFPDRDCPPHFYAMGNNPQYPYFKYLSGYMNRVCHLLNGGTTKTCVGLLYSAEGDWMDSKNCQPLEEICLALNQAQIDFTIIPEDELLKSRPEKRTYTVGSQTLPVLIINKRTYMTSQLARWCMDAATEGVQILFVDGIPETVSLRNDGNTETETLQNLPNVKQIQMVNLVSLLRQNGFFEIKPDTDQLFLRCYHYIQDDGEMILFFNEDPVREITDWIQVPFHSMEWYDAFDNRSIAAETEEKKVYLELAPYQMKILVNEKTGDADPNFIEECVPVPEIWHRTMINTRNEKVDERECRLGNVGKPDEFPDFSGTIEYEAFFTVEKCPDLMEFDMGQVFETAEVLINNSSVGVRIAPPYKLQVEGRLLQVGRNKICVRVTNTLGPQQLATDFFSMTLPQDPIGWLGPAVIKNKYKSSEG